MIKAPRPVELETIGNGNEIWSHHFRGSTHDTIQYVLRGTDEIVGDRYAQQHGDSRPSR